MSRIKHTQHGLRYAPLLHGWNWHMYKHAVCSRKRDFEKSIMENNGDVKWKSFDWNDFFWTCFPGAKGLIIGRNFALFNLYLKETLRLHHKSCIKEHHMNQKNMKSNNKMKHKTQSTSKFSRHTSHTKKTFSRRLNNRKMNFSVGLLT